MNSRKGGFGFFVLLGIALLVYAQVALAAAPNPPDTLTVVNSTTHVQATTGFAVPAQAGNVSVLNIIDSRNTQFWQGYYGNISGRVVLDDGLNATMFAWELASPSGEIYATNNSGSVNWNNMSCVNFTGNADEHSNGRINLSTLVVQFNMNTSNQILENLSRDAFNYTFNTTFSGYFTVGTSSISAASKCPQAYTFVNEAWQTSRFPEVLMHDNQSSLVFASILENDKNGYQAGNDDLNDFQLMVAEDGTPGKEAASTYYFYVELQ